MSGTYRIDGNLFPENPISNRWVARELYLAGTGEVVVSSLWEWEGTFAPMSESEFDFYMNRWEVGGLHSVVLPEPGDGTLTVYSGVSLKPPEGVRGDVRGYVLDGRIVITNIRKASGYTGVVA